MSEKYDKNERHLRLVTHFFTKLSQIVCLINSGIFIYRFTRCDYKLCSLYYLGEKSFRLYGSHIDTEKLFPGLCGIE